MKKIIEIVDNNTNKIILKDKNYEYNCNETVLSIIANGNFNLPDNMTIKITTIKDDFKIDDLCYYKNNVCKILKIDNVDDTARILLYTKPFKTDWCYLKDLIKIDNEDLKEAIND